ncbi:MAG TPA: DUF2085 domain-containing protein [Pyrinomonadaceae bacterium]|nr:DUF2085 domain-containing protein [Pyrinomonadaceae bacterium]
MPASPADYVSPFAPPREFSVRGAWAWVAVGALLWLGLIVCAPLAAAGGREATAFVIYQGLKAVCHQMSERAFWVAGHPLAVCARCFGVYAGFAVAVLYYPLSRRLRRMDTPRRVWLILALVPTAVDFTLGITGLWANTHSSRFITGAWLGAWAAFYVVPGAVEIGRQRRARRGVASGPEQKRIDHANAR